MTTKLQQQQTFYVSDALGYYDEFENSIKDITVTSEEDYFEIILEGYNSNFVSFYMDTTNYDKLVITTNLYGYTQQSTLEDGIYYSGRGYVSNYRFMELFKFYTFEEAFDIIKNAYGTDKA